MARVACRVSMANQLRIPTSIVAALLFLFLSLHTHSALSSDPSASSPFPTPLSDTDSDVNSPPSPDDPSPTPVEHSPSQSKSTESDSPSSKSKAFVVGIDWEAVAAWHLSLFRPDRVKAVVCFSVPYYPRDPYTKPTDSFRQLFGDGFYICQFQEPGRAERAFARYDYLTVMKKYLLMGRRNNLVAPTGMEIIYYLETPSIFPPWITEEELQVYADKYQESGFTGPFNYYRAMDLFAMKALGPTRTKRPSRNWELMASWQGAKITVPAKLIIGNKDIGFETLGTREYIQGPILKSHVPNIEVVILDGHHFIQLEKPQEVSHEILSFLTNFSTGS